MVDELTTTEEYSFYQSKINKHCTIPRYTLGWLDKIKEKVKIV